MPSDKDCVLLANYADKSLRYAPAWLSSWAIASDSPVTSQQTEPCDSFR